MHWIISIAVFVILAGVYAWMFFYARKRQKSFEAQYNAAKERRDVFVLNKRIVRERGQTRLTKFTKFKVYQVTGRITVSQSIRGVQMNKAQNVTFRTTKTEYGKIQANHKYKMDVAGDYIGYVVPQTIKGKAAGGKSATAAQPAEKRSWFRRRGQPQAQTKKTGKSK